MKTNSFRLTAVSFVLLSMVLASSPATFAHEPLDNVSEGFNRQIPNIPGKSLIAVQVDYAPGETTPAHRHDSSSFIMAYVVKGAIRSQVDDEPVRVYHAGETWFENPGAHHVVSENASDTEPARVLAVFVADANHGPLTTIED